MLPPQRKLPSFSFISVYPFCGCDVFADRHASAAPHDRLYPSFPFRTMHKTRRLSEVRIYPQNLLFRLNPDIDLISFKYCRFMPKFKRSPAVSKRSAAQQKGGRFRLRPLFVCMKKLTIEYVFAVLRQCCRSVISLLCDTCGCTCQTRPRMRDYPSSFRTEIHACSYCVCPHQ